MRAHVLTTLLLCNAALALSGADALAQPQPRMRPTLPQAQGLQPRLPPPPPGGAAATPGAAAAGGAPGGTAAAPGAPTGIIGPDGKPAGTTQGLTQFEPGVEYEPRAGGDRVSFSLEDADLPELVRVIGELTGKR
ncbi:MAG TPA: hypothetical protein VHS09_04795, partial [Polyangiaceae bacterium]|nr:hypothetical protein [Polyangiaceae bacterium]